MNEDELEVLDFDSDINEVGELKQEIYSSFKEKLPEPNNSELNIPIKEKEEKLPKEKKSKKNKNNLSDKEDIFKEKKKFKLRGQNIFCMISILFIIGCFIFYGSRLVKYYMIYNPKPIKGEKITLLGQYLKGNSEIVVEGSGLYKNSSGYVYRGNKVNNYVKYSGLLWRIIKVYEDGSMDIVSDDIINSLMWNKNKSDYVSSDINKYLNEYFIKYINKDLIVNTTICEDQVLNISDVTCDFVSNENFVRLLSTNEFINSKTDEESYINEEDDLWTYNRSDSGTWIINSLNVSNAFYNKVYGIKPVVKLKNSIARISGKGTKNDPYIIEKNVNKVKIGDYISLSGDRWIVYDIDEDNIRLVSNKKISKQYRFDVKDNIFNPNNKYSVAEYLNVEYYNSLTYKEKLLRVKWYNGEYKNSYEEIKKDNVTANVGLLNVVDLKLVKTENPYYLITPAKSGHVYMYNNELVENKVNMARDIYPTIAIENKKIESGKGTEKNPYILGD